MNISKPNRLPRISTWQECSVPASSKSVAWWAGILSGFLSLPYFASVLVANETESQAPFVIVLGIAQDGGFPQAGCRKPCCLNADPMKSEPPVGLALVDPQSNQRWMFECTPQFPTQLRRLDQAYAVDASPGLDGIFLTHAHIGHYSGLIHLGREVMGSRDVPVYAMPRMRKFLSKHGPWKQLLALQNIRLEPLEERTTVHLNDRLTVTPMTVPHRDEFSETVAFRVAGPKKSILFLPDIDKWDRWNTSIESVLKTVDVAYLDATFFDGDELPGRDMSEIPHPFIVESMKRFESLPASERRKIRFIHLNHTNPALKPNSKPRRLILDTGMQVAKTGERVSLE